MADLTALLERITKAKGADREIDRNLGLALAGWEENDDLSSPSLLIDGTYYADSPDGGYPAFTASIDAALGLVEKVLPGNRIIIDTRNPIRVKLYPEGLESHSDKNLTGYAATAPLAVLAALIRAKISEAG